MVSAESLPAAFRRGLEALRSTHCPEAQATAIDGNFAIVHLGSGPLPEFYVEREAQVFARAPLDFVNAEPYGVITLPFLTLKDGRAIAHQHRGHQNAKPVEPVGGAATGFWSWKWGAMRRSVPEDMAKLFEWAWKCVREPDHA